VPEEIASPLAKALRQLAAPPAAGNGVHQWLFATACSFHEAGVSTAAKIEYLRQASRNVRRNVPEREIKGAVTAAEAKTASIVAQSSANNVVRFASPEPA